MILSLSFQIFWEIVVPSRYFLVPKPKHQRIPFQPRILANRTITQVDPRRNSPSIWSRYHSDCLVWHLHILPRNFLGTTGLVHYENQVRHVSCKLILIIFSINRDAPYNEHINQN